MAQPHCKRPMTELNLTPKFWCTEQNPVTQLILCRILHHKWLSCIVSDPWLNWILHQKCWVYRAKPSDSTDFVPNLTPKMAQPHSKRPNDWIKSYTKNVGCTEQNPVTPLILRRNLTPQMAQPHSKRPWLTWILHQKRMGAQSKTQWLNWFCTESYTTNGSAAL